MAHHSRRVSVTDVGRACASTAGVETTLRLGPTEITAGSGRHDVGDGSPRSACPTPSRPRVDHEPVGVGQVNNDPLARNRSATELSRSVAWSIVLAHSRATSGSTCSMSSKLSSTISTRSKSRLAVVRRMSTFCFSPRPTPLGRRFACLTASAGGFPSATRCRATRRPHLGSGPQ